MLFTSMSTLPACQGQRLLPFTDTPIVNKESKLAKDITKWDVWLVFKGSAGTSTPLIRGVATKLRAESYAMFERIYNFLNYETALRPSVVVVPENYMWGDGEEMYRVLTTQPIDEDYEESFKVSLFGDDNEEVGEDC